MAKDIEDLRRKVRILKTMKIGYVGNRGGDISIDYIILVEYLIS